MQSTNPEFFRRELISNILVSVRALAPVRVCALISGSLYNRPLESSGDWFWDILQTPKFADPQFPYTDWHGTKFAHNLFFRVGYGRVCVYLLHSCGFGMGFDSGRFKSCFLKRSGIFFFLNIFDLQWVESTDVKSVDIERLLFL